MSNASAPYSGGITQILDKFGDQSVVCNQYALAKLGVDRNHCFLKIEDYTILCVPFQLGFKRALFLASLSRQELTFFQRYTNGIVGLSIVFMPIGRKAQEAIKFFIRCTLSTLSPMKGREDVGLFALDFKVMPDELAALLGSYLDSQEKIKLQYEDYGADIIKMTPATAKMMGYNLYATITEPNAAPKRIQLSCINTKTIEHLEAEGSATRPQGASVAYQLYFKKFRLSVAGSVLSAYILPQRLVRTQAKLSFSPELVEIIDDYWHAANTNTAETEQ